MVAVVDTSIYICKAVYSNTNVLQYLMQMVALLEQCGIVPVLILDGEPPAAKDEVLQYRQDKRTAYMQKAKEHEDAGNYEEAVKIFRKTFRRNDTLDDEITKMCRDKKIRFIKSPQESDAQLAFMSINGFADLVITEDSDLIAFGCPKILFKLKDGIGDFYEQSSLCAILGGEVDMESFRAMSIIRGSDYYLGGVDGIGPVKSLKLYKNVAHNFSIEKMVKFITKKLKIEVEEDFEERYFWAASTFKFQFIIHPDSGEIMNLNPVDDSTFDIELLINGNVADVFGEVYYWDTKEDVAEAEKLTTVPTFQIWYHCRSCPDKFDTSQDLKDHRDKVHPLVCTECDKTFVKPCLLADHMLMHKRDVFLL